MRDVLSSLLKTFGFGSHTEPVPSAPAAPSEPVSATVLEWLSWEGETFNEKLAWLPGAAC